MLKVIFAAAALLLSGCVSSQFMPVGPKTYPPRPTNYLIEIYVPAESPVVVQQAIGNAKPTETLPKNAEMIGRVDTNGASDASWASVFADAQSKARLLGGDAIVVRRWGNPVSGMVYGQAIYAKAISMDVMRFGTEESSTDGEFRFKYSSPGSPPDVR